MTFVHRRAQAPTHPDSPISSHAPDLLPEDATPASRTSDDDRVLRCAGLDDAIRWHEGERLEDLFEECCDRFAGALAVDGPARRLTYAQLDAQVNRLARLLARRGAIRPGDRVGLLFDRSVDAYLAMLAVLKLRAVYVPLDTGFPPDRLAYITSDAGVRVVLSQSELAPALEDVGDQVERLFLDELRAPMAALSPARLTDGERGEAADDLCYVIYTSGTTGRPKGVAIGHASICNFVRVAAEVYGVRAGDRMYQGLTIAFDFAVEEIWVAWMAGATLVPRPGAGNLLGPDLQEFLADHRVSALCCVPTLLATLEDDLPGLRFLLVSGESCPQELANRWARPGRRFLNVYGPTEATVTATWTVLRPDRPVTIGVPLPTYAIVILDPAEDRPLPLGQQGEIGIAGIGLAEGYLNNPERTRQAFIPDVLGISGNPSRRIYRTGDLGRVNGDGEVEHHGRIDTQVKIRGYRIEPGEIEAVLSQVPNVGQAVVGTHRPASGVEELVGYYTARPGGEEVDAEGAYAALREKLPAYMVPAYLERLGELPLLPSGKVDRARLPSPQGRRTRGAETYVAPESELETLLAGELAGALGADRVSAEDHFFGDLGASSLLMARFNAQLRRHGGLPRVSMRDVYLNPTVRRLAEAISERVPGGAAAAPGDLAEPALPAPEGTPRYVLCGALQLLAFLVYAGLAAAAFGAAASWTAAAEGAIATYARAAVAGGGLLLAAGLMPILAKWLLVGRWRPRRIRVWSLPYVRFWIVRTLVIGNPLARLVAGTALYNLYLRALGATVGKGAVVFTRHVPVCTDLVEIGAGAVIEKDTYLNGYRARSGVLELGAVSVGRDAFVGEHCVLDIATTLHDGAQLGHASSLQAGQTVPGGARWHGSPAETAGDDSEYRSVAPARCGSLRRALYGVAQLTAIVTCLAPLTAGLPALIVTRSELLAGVPYAAVPVLAVGAVVALLLVALLVSSTVPRLLSRLLAPGRVYPLYGVRYAVMRIVARTSNLAPVVTLFGDSSAIVTYLRALGYRLGDVEQTGSNFGLAVKHDVPGLCRVGRGTMVSDGLSIANAQFSSSSFRLLAADIGARNFLGNTLVFPAGARTGDNCLLATKAMVPVGGPVREGVGLLGSPCFEIPRSVDADPELVRRASAPERERRLPAKNRHNAGSMAMYLLRWAVLLSALLLVARSPFGEDSVMAAALVVVGLVTVVVALLVLVDRIVRSLWPIEPRICSIYDEEFWRHERFWKVPATGYFRIFDGTPFKTLLWRLVGVRVGRRLFDDGCLIVERPLVSLGSDVTLNMGGVVQGHSLEDGVFKCDAITIGSRCTVGTGAFVHYGALMEDESLLEADSFLMKGSHVYAGDRWLGNPATGV